MPVLYKVTIPEPPEFWEDSPPNVKVWFETYDAAMKYKTELDEMEVESYVDSVLVDLSVSELVGLLNEQ